MSKKVNDSFIMELENLSDNDEDNIFKSDRSNNSNVKNLLNSTNSSININFVENSDKLLNYTKLRHNKRFKEFIVEIEIDRIKQNNNQNSQLSNTFKLFKESNIFIVEINHDINLISKYIKEVYSKRFPELESQILTPYEYSLTVKALGNDLDIMKKDLSFLPNHNIMAINIISSTTSGKPLNDFDLKRLNLACDEIITLNKNKLAILSYIETKMNLIAPNVCALVGANVAAKLVTSAGGIVELAKLPASNILVMGSQKINTEGFSTAGKLHLGYLAEIEEIRKTPDDFKRQAIRRYSNKVALAARSDAFKYRGNEGNIKVPNNIEQNFEESEKDGKFKHFFDDDSPKKQESNIQIEENGIENKDESRNKLEGEKLKDEISKKMMKIQEPKQARIVKPLPKPDDKPRRKRGGRRLRSQKQIYMMTEIRQMKNRMKFGEEAEIEYRGTGKGFGTIGVGGTGSKLKISTKQQKINTKKQKIANIQSTKENHKSGLMSNVSFTPFEGMELINPNVNDRANINNKYFKPTSGFSTVINSNSSNSSIINLNK